MSLFKTFGTLVVDNSVITRLLYHNNTKNVIARCGAYMVKGCNNHQQRLLCISPALNGKNIYYGYAQKKNEQRRGPIHTFAMASVCGIILVLCTKGPDIIEWLGLDVNSRELENEPNTQGHLDQGAVEEIKERKKKVTFREKRIIEYENRIRNYSTPDKIFRYFATLKVKLEGADEHYEIYMTPEDFVRSLMPGIMQPEGLGLDRFKKIDPKQMDNAIRLQKNSIFYRLEKHGLISFSDYIFLLTLLSTPSRQFELAFKMFDENGDGNLDQQEYEKVQTIIRSRTNIGQRHRDHANTGNVIKMDSKGALSKYFFGEKLDQKLSHQKFLQFHKDLQDEILWIEFHQFSDDDDKISERDFANQILLYAGFSDQKRVSICRRVRKMFKDEDRAHGITFDEYYGFSQVLKTINEIDTALTFYHVAGAAIDKQTLKHVAKTVSHVQLTDHLVDVVFAIFDENNDERLSNKEFVAVMKRRLMRGLEKPKETGFTKVLSAIVACSKSYAIDRLTAVRDKISD